MGDRQTQDVTTQVTGMEEPRGDNAGRFKLSYNGRYHDARTQDIVDGLAEVIAHKGWIAAKVASKKGERTTFYDLHSWEPSAPPDVGAQRVAPAAPAAAIIPTVSVMAKLTVNLGNYESASIELGIAGLPAGASQEEIMPLLDTGELTYKLIHERLTVQAQSLRDHKHAGPVGAQRATPAVADEAPPPQRPNPRLDPSAQPKMPAATAVATEPPAASEQPVPDKQSEWIVAFQGISTIAELNRYQHELDQTKYRNVPDILKARDEARARITSAR